MSKIVIKKHVSLEFLGEEYKEAELVFRSIPLSDYDKLMDELPKTDPELADLTRKKEIGEITDKESRRLDELSALSSEENKKSLRLILNYLKKYFVSGKFPGETGELESVEAEDIEGLDQETAMYCFERLTGQLTDPKAPSQSTTPSSTAVPPPEVS